MRSGPSVRGAGYAALLLVLAAHLWVLYAPSPPGPPLFAGADKLGHAVVFAAPVLFGLLAGLRPPLVLGVLIVHAPVSEVVQAVLLPGRTGDPWDAVADLVGVGLGYAGWWLVRRRFGAG